MATTTLKVQKSGEGASDSIQIAPDCPTNVIGMVIVPSGATVAVQYTLDDSEWLAITDMGALTASNDFTLVFPVLAVRLYVATAAATPCKLIVRQDDGRYR